MRVRAGGGLFFMRRHIARAAEAGLRGPASGGLREREDPDVHCLAHGGQAGTLQGPGWTEAHVLSSPAPSPGRGLGPGVSTELRGRGL